MEALEDLQKSIELNDNRAVYRSRLMLDEDLAARSASLARTYNDLGFQQLALVEGWNSVNADPANYSAHRFLADSYAALPRHEIARVSELLQSQLLQPINITPVQPHLAESKRSILNDAGPSDPSFNEFNPLFNRNRLALQASGVAGGNSILGDELVQSGVWGRYSYSIGQFHYETDGFRENNDQDQDIYNAFAQVALSHKTSVQAEYRYTYLDNGDLELRFDPDYFLKDQREERKTKTGRIGFHRAFASNSDVIGSIIFQDNHLEIKQTIPSFGAFVMEEDRDGYLSEIQHLFRSDVFNVSSGGGYFHSDRKCAINMNAFGKIAEDDKVVHYTDVYAYSQINFPRNFIWTIGASMDFFREVVDCDQFNPKVGLIWNPIPQTTLRIAAFRVLRRTLFSDQTLEPTQVSGFNQFFDDPPGTDSWRYGIALDQKFSSSFYGGVEFSKRDLDVVEPVFCHNQTLKYDKKEWFNRVYLYWTPHPRLSTSAEWYYEKLDSSLPSSIWNVTQSLRTNRVPFGVNFFHPSGFIAGLKATYTDQKGKFVDSEGHPVSDSDHFWLLDASIGYRLPKRLGLITIDAKNLLNEKFKYQEIDPANFLLYPESLIFTRFTLAF